MVKKKKKIGVSLHVDLLKYLDAIIDDTKIKNRSQAIEHMIRKGMGVEKVKDAVLFLYQYDLIYFQYTYKKQPFLPQIIHFLKEGGIERVFILSQHPAHKLEPHLQSVNWRGIKPIIRYFPKELYNLPMLYAIQEELDDTFLVTNADTLQSFQLSKMIEFFLNSGKLATILLEIYTKPELYESILVEGNSVIQISPRGKPKSNIVYGGTSILHKRIFDILDKDKDFYMELHLFQKLIKIKQISGFFTHGNYQHMPDIYDKEYATVRKTLIKKLHQPNVYP